MVTKTQFLNSLAITVTYGWKGPYSPLEQDFTVIICINIKEYIKNIL